MKTALIILFLNLGNIALAVGAAILAYHQKEGWGWMLCVLLLNSVSYKSTRKGEEADL
jgi:hypothetical protein